MQVCKKELSGAELWTTKPIIPLANLIALWEIAALSLGKYFLIPQLLDEGFPCSSCKDLGGSYFLSPSSTSL